VILKTTTLFQTPKENFMKTIAVLTDFSERADNAALYALHFAQHLHANILLYNSFFVAAADPISAQIAWPMEDIDELRHDSGKELGVLAAKLKKELSLSGDGFIPVISCKYHEGNLSPHLDELLADRDIVLLVMGTHEKGIASLMTGNHMQELLDKVLLPVLIVPEHQVFKPIHKIAFATDLDDGDIGFIHSLSTLAKHFDAEILIAHSTEEDYNNQEDQHKTDDFLRQITNKIDYDKIYYRPIKNMDISKALDWLNEHGQIEILAMVHRHKSFLERIFTRSYTQRMAAHISLPLLVYPDPIQSVIVF
jgi:nucleotide-binding universal stress UspA family protein